MPNYVITESVGNRVERVNSYADLEKHHPSSGRERGRDYQTIDGELEEVRIKNRPEPHVKKDFIIDPPSIPAPASGTIRNLNDAFNTVQIVGDNGQVLAQSLHMQRGSQPANGSRIEYGQTMGRMGDVGSPGSVHAHVEAPARVFERYINDMTSGRIQSNGAAVSTPAVNADPMADGVLRRGEQGAAVTKLQEDLTKAGFPTQGTDGKFGQNTEDALKRYQTSRGLEADGIAGQTTLKAIKENQPAQQQQPTTGEPTQPSTGTVTPTQPAPTPTTPTASTQSGAMSDSMLKQGEKGEDVRKLQEALNKNGAKLETDGNFGPATKAAVETYQRSNNLDVDGVAGAKTLAALGMQQQAQTSAVTQPAQNDKPQAPANAQPTQADKPPMPTDTQPAAQAQAETRVQQAQTLQQGDSGPAVKQLQEALAQHGGQCSCGKHGLTTDGNYGDITKRAVEQFQEFRGMPVTGIADSKTLIALGIDPQKVQGNTSQTPSQTPTAQTPTAQTAPAATDKPQTPATGNDQVQPPTQNDKPLISNPNHPDNKLYQQAVSNLEQLGPSGGFKSREEMEKAAAAVAVDAKATGLQSIDHVSKTNAPNGQSYLVAVQGDPTSPAAKNSYIDYNQATSQTVAQSTSMAEGKSPAAQMAAQPTQQTEQPQQEPIRIGAAR